MTQSVTELQNDRVSISPAIPGKWVHSREEDADGIEVYRPSGFDFPPSFGRDGFELRRDGVAIVDEVGPADGVVQVPGRWRQPAVDTLVITFDGSEHAAFTLRAVSFDDLVLRVRRLPGLPGHPGVVGVDETGLREYRSLPAPETSRVLDFDHARVVSLRSLPPELVLQVDGTKPSVSMEVALRPFVYVRRPEYWEIEVVGTLSGIGLPVVAPYEASLVVTSVRGSRGIEVVGATRRQRIDLAE